MVERMPSGGVSGELGDERFEPILDMLASFAREDPDYRAQVSAYRGGQRLFDLAVGPDFPVTALTGVYSCTKGIAALAFASLLDEGAIELDRPVTHYWPEFGAAGKGSITVRQLLSHQAGVLGVDGGFTVAEYADSRDAAARLAREPTQWRPGTMFGYHALTIGIFLEELTRRVSGTTIQHLYETRIRAPFDVDCYLGLPDDAESRFCDVLFEQGFGDEQPTDAIDGIERLAMNSTGASPVLFPNLREIRAAGIASVGAISSAAGLARAYAVAVTGVEGSAPLIGSATVAAFSQEEVWGIDRVLKAPMSYSIVFMKPSPRIEFGSHRAFGHEGSGGSLGFADPRYGLAFGYVPQRREGGGSAGKAARLARETQRLIPTLTDRP